MVDHIIHLIRLPGNFPGELSQGCSPHVIAAHVENHPAVLTGKDRRAVLEDINPRDSWRASKAFRKHIAVEMAKRALIESVKRCGGEI